MGSHTSSRITTRPRTSLTRAIPLLTLISVAEVFGALNLQGPVWANVLSIVGNFAILPAGWVGSNTARRWPALAGPDRVGRTEVAVFVLLPALLPAAFGGQVVDAVATAAGNFALPAVIYPATSCAVLPIARWAIVRTVRQYGNDFDLLVRTLPLLLPFVMFLFINAEVWQVARPGCPLAS